ncbi:MAG: tRNA uridine-5-carboxymethylaminomethyl(34) synthesis GTPase MnmE [Campylobacterales bacterium]|nr:tRNA uridine-5-carboxymethylaminomethyl(34) synthesis GTPase MnmE [Campylobacterales bacterium]
MNTKTINEDTIVAIATANGIGSIGIVRLSGSMALKIALNISKRKSLNPRMATLSKLYNISNQLIDEVILLYFQNPHSFTGEDIVEFQCHGGSIITQMILKECLLHGARVANAGEFSKRAFLNGKIDLSQAMAIAKLIEARSEEGVKLLARQLKGELKNFVDSIKDDMLFILAYTEVTIDYATEDLPDDILQTIQIKLDFISEKLQNTLEASCRREGLIEGFKIAIIGKPNVGKSSLLNKLLNFNRAIVSDIAGTTRDTIEESVKIGTHLIKIVDTAGIREASDEIEKIGIQRSKEAVDQSDIIIALFDGSREFDQEDQKVIELLEYSQKESIVVVTKSDLESKLPLDKLKSEYISVNTNKSINTLVEKIESILDSNSYENGITLVATNQIEAVKETLEKIKNSKDPLARGELEFFSYYINEALQAISKITRPYEYDQMLDQMFGQFCLGK